MSMTAETDVIDVDDILHRIYHNLQTNQYQVQQIIDGRLAEELDQKLDDRIRARALDYLIRVMANKLADAFAHRIAEDDLFRLEDIEGDDIMMNHRRLRARMYYISDEDVRQLGGLVHELRKRGGFKLPIIKPVSAIKR